MGKKIVLSPSNMDSYRTCPLRFYGQSIVKDLPWKASASKLRGTQIHADIEKCLKRGWDESIAWDSTIDTGYAHDMVQTVRSAVKSGSKLYVEHEMSIDKHGLPTGWWSETALLRAKADAVVVGDGVARVIDIKTGRRWDSDDFQLRIECLLIHLLYAIPVVRYEYWYVDQSETWDGQIDFRRGLDPVHDIYDTMREMLQSMRDNDFPAKRNKFCRWCDYNNTEKCHA